MDEFLSFEKILAKGLAHIPPEGLLHTLILTPTTRAVSFLCADFFKSQFWQERSAHIPSQSAPFLPFQIAQSFTDFKVSLWEKWQADQSLMGADCLVTDFPERLPLPIEIKLWEQAARKSHAGVMNDVPGAWFANGYRQLIEWSVRETVPGWASTAESLTFEKMIDWFEKKCQEKKWMSDAHLLDYLLSVDLTTYLKSIQHIILWNFLNLSPKERRFLQALQEQYGIDISPVHFSSFYQKDKSAQKKRVKKVAFQKPEQEYFQAIAWAKKKSEENPSARIAIVVPQIDEKRSLLQEAAQRNWPEALISLDHQRYKQYINISGGFALSQVPLVKTFLAILHMGFSQANFEWMYYLLSSPYIGRHAGMGAQTHAMSVRSDWQRSLSIDLKSQSQWLVWLDYLKRKNVSNAEPFRDDFFIAALIDTRQLFSSNDEKNISEWYQVIEKVLMLWMWPHGVVLTSDEYQAWQSVVALVQEWQTWDQWLGKVSYREAVQLLVERLHQHPFQSESVSENIQILGLLEAESLPFDAVWIVNLNQNALPEPLHPNPFIPFHITSFYSLPHANILQEGLIAQNRLYGWVGLATDVVMSWCAYEGDRHILPCTLIDLFDPEEMSVNDRLIQSIAPIEIEAALDHSGAVLLPENGIIKLSLAVLKDQSDCPFKSYAKHRLNAGELLKETEKLSPLMKGQLLHKALEFFWQETKDHAQLIRYDANDLREKIISILDKTFITIFSSVSDRAFLTEPIVHIEKERMLSLLEQWLSYEKTRVPFSVVSVEKKIEAVRSGVLFSVRLDRVDELPSGDFLILDYKTGSFFKSSWSHPRLSEPQLPFYALIDEKALGVMVCQIKLDAFKYIGMVCDSQSHHWQGFSSVNLIEDWVKQKETWQRIIDELIAEVKLGVAEVRPRSKAICQFCEYGSFCRKNKSIEYSIDELVDGYTLRY